MSAPLWFISGPPGVGKTAVSRLLASGARAHLYDVDDELERTFKESVSSLIETRGWTWFRAAEREVVSELISRAELIDEPLSEHDRRVSVVISLGGGSVTSEETRALIRASGVLVTLWAEPELIRERQRRRQRIAPERDRPTPEAELERLLSSRFESYRDCDLWIESLEGESPIQLAERVSRALKRYDQGGGSTCDLPPLTIPLSISAVSAGTPTALPLTEVSQETPIETPTQIPADQPAEILTETPSESPAETPADQPTETLAEPPAETSKGGAPYPIDFADQSDSSLLERLIDWAQLDVEPPSARRRLVIVSDEIVARLHSAPLTGMLQSRGAHAHLVTFPVGERSKSLRVLESLVTELLNLNIDRDDKLIALGGGVTGDLCGLLAALYLRGVSWAQVPTTLLAQVDSSVGAKTAVNHPLGKNLIGAFYRPSWVWIDELYLSTLSPRHLRAGWVEALKHGLISDAKLFYDLSALTPQLSLTEREPIRWGDLLRRSVEVKVQIVARDELERGERALLNLGHTLGHALEATRHDLLHGEAVALGLCAIIEYSCVYGSLTIDEARVTMNALSSAGLDIDWRGALNPQVWRALRLDKKRTRVSIRLVLLERIGSAYLEETLVDDLVERLEMIAGHPPLSFALDEASLDEPTEISTPLSTPDHSALDEV